MPIAIVALAVVVGIGLLVLLAVGAAKRQQRTPVGGTGGGDMAWMSGGIVDGGAADSGCGSDGGGGDGGGGGCDGGGGGGD
jgi:hypothetical protein